MRDHENRYIEDEVKNMIPVFWGWVFRNFFPNTEAKLIERVKEICQMIIDWQKLQKE